MTAPLRKLGATVLIGAAAVLSWMGMRSMTAGPVAAGATGGAGAAPQKLRPENKKEELARLEEQELLESEELTTLYHEIEEAEASLAAGDARFRRYREIWDLFRGWWLHTEARGGNDFMAHPGMPRQKQLLWLEEYDTLLKEAETGPMVRRFLEDRDRKYREGGNDYRERMALNSRQSWSTGDIGLASAVPPGEIMEEFLRGPASTLSGLRAGNAAGGGESLTLTPDQEVYVRDALRAQILSASARQAMDGLLPPEIQAKQKRAYVLTINSPEITRRIARLREELRSKKP